MANEHLGQEVPVNIDMNGVGAGGASWVLFGKRQDIDSSDSTEMVDVTHADSGGHKKNLPGDRSGSLTINAIYHPGDSTQAYAYARYKAKQQVWIQVDESGIGGLKEEAPYWITDFGKPIPRVTGLTVAIQLTRDAAPVTSP